jgi:DNA primase
MSAYIDFKAVKAAITMEQLLKHYGLFDQFKRSGDNLSGPCPVHKGSNPTQFRVSISKNIWNCFSECKNGGNVLDFIAKMEDVSIHAAALKAIQWFNLDPNEISSDDSDDKAENRVEKSKASASRTKPKADRVEAAQESNGPNKPLKFRLEKLDRAHPYLTQRGLTTETIVDFGIGYCAKGVMAERIAIPIHNLEGNVVAYAGRFPGEPSGDVPKYKLPQGFKKSLELFNIDRAAKEPTEKPLVIVEGFFDCMKLHQNGYRKVVALMGSSLSPAQEEIIRKATDSKSRIIVMLDEDDAGRTGREDIAGRLAKFAFVKVHTFEQENSQPEELSAEDVTALLG